MILYCKISLIYHFMAGIVIGGITVGYLVKRKFNNKKRRENGNRNKS